MKRPVWMIIFPLLLSGCSSLGVSNWFGSSDTVNGDSVLGLDADTPVTADAISRQLGDGYQIRTGMQLNGKDVLPYAEVRQNDARVMTVNGKADGQVASVDIDSPQIKTQWGTHVGSRFGDIYPQALGANCKIGQVEVTSAVICQAPQDQRIRYVFSGDWNGPQTLLPPDETLRNWQIKQILWQASPSQ
ncbi:MAG: DUF1131 family protein [Plesiomonas sp.]